MINIINTNSYNRDYINLWFKSVTTFYFVCKLEDEYLELKLKLIKLIAIVYENRNGLKNKLDTTIKFTVSCFFNSHRK